MRFTSRLYAQHLGWTFKKHWQTQGKRIPSDTGAARELEKFGINVKSPEDVVREGYKYVKEMFPNSHKNSSQWNGQSCYVYGNDNVLLEGLPQAQRLTNTVLIPGLPQVLQDSIANMKVQSNVERNFQFAVMNAGIFDAEQTLLPRIRNMDRPAFKYPRMFGPSYQRRNRILINKLINECEKLASTEVSTQRRIVDNPTFKVTLTNNECSLQMNLKADKIITSSKPLEPFKGKFDSQMPDLYPTKSTISLQQENCYNTETKYPLNYEKYSHPHTVITFFDKERLKNLHGSEISLAQFQSRTLLSAFTVAATRAKQLYGDTDLEALPKPIVIQSVQTDGSIFDFGVFQLNTLNIDERNHLKNYWFQGENMDLYKVCCYLKGQPRLDGCNRNVLRHIVAFYNNL
ncbi:mitochondrial ribosomal protein L37 [Musca autumnalis]|uniref:mitochondrial ribosomal protein L37 n=1 Tax=Musca autumnalis TaxID=221902 RepID=UPI003CEC3826